MSFFHELKRRNVVKTAVLYGVSAWLILQVADLLFDLMGLPTAWLRLVLALLILGCPLVLIFSWVFEMTPEGLKRERDIDRSHSITPETGRKINVLIAVLLVLAIASVVVDRMIPETSETAATDEPADASGPSDALRSADPDPTAAAAGKFAPPPARSIAVLPFVNMSGQADNEYFADGLSEEILNFLADVPDLHVTARTSSFQFKGQNLDIREAARKLGVAHVLEGSVRRSGDRARITAQLIRAADGYHLWSETYDRTLEDTFVVQTDIAESVTRALGVVMDETQRRRLLEVGVRDVEAFVYFQRARQMFYDAHSNEIDMTMLAESADLFGEAIRVEPGFAGAYHLRSDFYAHTMTMVGPTMGERETAHERYDSDLGAASKYARGADARALIELDRALASSSWRSLPDRFEAALASTTCDEAAWIEVAPVFGFADAALARDLHMIDCDPLNFFHYYGAAIDLVWAGRPAEALAMAERGFELAPNHPFLQNVVIQALLADGRYEEALNRAQRGSGWNYEANLCHVAAATGDLDRARDLAAKAIADAGPWLRRFRALQLYAITGDRAAANEEAAWFDGLPGGPLMLSGAIMECKCGSLFDLEATPVFKARIEEAGIEWPPPAFVDYPALPH